MSQEKLQCAFISAASTLLKIDYPVKVKTSAKDPDPLDFGFLDPDPQKYADPDPSGKISTKNSTKTLYSNQIWTFEKKDYENFFISEWFKF